MSDQFDGPAMAQQIFRLQQQVAELEADAARYRWLRDTQNTAIRDDSDPNFPDGAVEDIFVSLGNGVSCALSAGELDAAIDAARGVKP